MASLVTRLVGGGCSEKGHTITDRHLCRSAISELYNLVFQVHSVMASYHFIHKGTYSQCAMNDELRSECYIDVLDFVSDGPEAVRRPKLLLTSGVSVSRGAGYPHGYHRALSKHQQSRSFTS